MMTKLDAVNAILHSAGFQRVNTLHDDASKEALDAIAVLHEVNGQLQAQGWHFNTYHDWPLPRTASGEIHLPQNCLAADIDPPGTNVKMQGGKLFDLDHKSFVFDQAIKADRIVLRLDFESECPPHYQYYCVAVATRRFIENALGVSEVWNLIKRNEDEARAEFLRVENSQAAYNMLDHISNYRPAKSFL